MRKIGLTMHQHDFDAAENFIRLMKQYGFDSTCTESNIKTEADQAKLAEMIVKHGISYESIHAPFAQINDIWFDTADGRQKLAELKTAVDRCVLSNVLTMVVHLSGGFNPPAPTDIGRGRFIDLVEYATAQNVHIAFENLRSLANLAWAFEEFKDASHVGFCWDCGHEYCFTPGIHFMPLFGDKLIFTHIHDNTCELGLDRHLIPFDGTMPFDDVAKQFKTSGYQGTLMSESFPKFQEGIYDSYQDCSAEDFIRRSAEAMKRLRTMIDGE